MKKTSKKVKVLILALVLIIFSSACILISGNTYTAKINLPDEIQSVQEILVVLEDGEKTVTCTDKKIKNNVLYLTLEAVSTGQTILQASADNHLFSVAYQVYVHAPGIITFESFFGDCSGAFTILLSILIFLAYALYLLIKSYRESLRASLCQYKNIVLLALIIFISFVFVQQLFSIFTYKGLSTTVGGILSMFSSFSILLLPLTFVVSVLVIISNLVLIKREGFTLHNMLGLLLGGLLCFGTVFPELLYHIVGKYSTIDIHHSAGIAFNIAAFVEAATYIFVAYLECVLLATIISAFRAARHIPAFDKDYILILGCQINDDGTLTRLLQSRVDRALEFYRLQKEKTGKELSFVPSGGQGSDEITSEAEAIGSYLLSCGIPEEKILLENKSVNTRQNILFSKKLIDGQTDNAKIAFSTTNYHVFRAGALAHELGIEIEGIGAKTKAYFWINAFIREFIATLFTEKKKHIAVLALILLLCVAVIGVQYLCNII